jgi:two-component system sensor histidine kinase AlgZ
MSFVSTGRAECRIYFVLSNWFQRAPRFWLLQLVGWVAYAGIAFVDVLPRFSERAPVIYDTVFVGTLFLASLLLRLVCRWIWRRKTPWPSAMLRAGVVAILLGVPCGALAEWSWNLVKGNRIGWHFLLDAWGGMVYATFVLISWSALYLGIKHYQAFQAEHERVIQAEALAREARLQALRYQLSPHFLFNTLNAISTLVVEGDSLAANRMLVQLANFLRSTLDGMGAQEVSLNREISNTEQYLAIEKARLGEHLELDFAIAAEVQDALVPTLLLQPLVENAVRHGIAPKNDGGKLTIKAVPIDGRVRISISDTGVGSRTAKGIEVPRRGLGLSNTLERLAVLYGSDHRLAVHWPLEGGCLVEIEFPYKAADPLLLFARGEEMCVL